MLKEINGKVWFCCPQCGKKIHPVAPGAGGVYVVCKQRRDDGKRCSWRGECCWPKDTAVWKPE